MRVCGICSTGQYMTTPMYVPLKMGMLTVTTIKSVEMFYNAMSEK